MKKLITLLCGLLLTAATFAQTEETEMPKIRHWSVFVKGGLSAFDGDVMQKYNEFLANADKNLGFGIGGEYSFNPRWGLGFEYNYLQYSAEASNLGFSGTMQVPSVYLSANLSNLFYDKRKRYKWDVYFDIGIGIGFYDVESTHVPAHPVLIQNPTGPKIQPHRIKDGRAGAAVGGLNIEYNFTPSLAVAWSNKYRMFNKDNLEAADYQWGNTNDNIFTSMIGIRYKFWPKKDVHTRNLDWMMYNDLRDPAPNNDELLKRLDDIDKRLAALEERPMSTMPDIDKLQRQVDSIDAFLNEQFNGVDTDGDGVPDVRDREPNTPKGSFVNFWGQSIPTQMASVIPSIFFAFDSAELDQRSIGIIKEVALRMAQNSDMKVEIRAYTDYMGTDSYNAKLSMRRAMITKKQLVDVHKIEADRIKCDGVLNVEGEISADIIDAKGKLNAEEIVGDHITIKSYWKRGVGGLFLALGEKISEKWSAKFSVIGLIEGTTVELRGVRAKSVSGQNVYLGKNCKIDRVNASGELSIHPTSQVDEVINS